MKLIDGLKLKGKPAEIPDCSRDDLPDFFNQMGYKVGAEIGVDRGEFSEKICQAGLSLYSIDPWHSYSDYSDKRSIRRIDALYESTKNLLSKYPKCKVIRKTSMDAVPDFAENSLDFVYIDGNHQFKYIAEDLYEWTKRVRPGGCIAGHDYIYTSGRTLPATCHVIHVLNAYTKAYGINNWYLIGRKENREGEKRDHFRSWMFIKK